MKITIKCATYFNTCLPWWNALEYYARLLLQYSMLLLQIKDLLFFFFTSLGSSLNISKIVVKASSVLFGFLIFQLPLQLVETMVLDSFS